MSQVATYNFSVNQGATWDEEITLLNADGTPMVLTGFVARMQLRVFAAASEFALELNDTNGRLVITDAANGRLRITVSAEDTRTLCPYFEPEAYMYDLELSRALPAPEYVRKALAGAVFVYPEITR